MPEQGNDKDTLVELLFQMSEILYAIEEAIHAKNEWKLLMVLFTAVAFSAGVCVGALV